MVQVFYIREWDEKFWFNTGGTRAKKYVERPDGKHYYYKRSEYKSATETKLEKDYRFEFWSEIIAFHVGTLLGFDVLRYDIAIDGKIAGCICEDMIKAEKEQLIEGVKYLQGFDNEFNPEDKKKRSQYSFQLIEAALDNYRIGHFKKNIVEMIVFDAIIGNVDRHQENWAIVSEFPKIVKRLTWVEKILNQLIKQYPHKKWPKFLKKEIAKIYDFEKQRLKEKIKDAMLVAGKLRFAPFYDNGSSLGRELTENRITVLLTDKNQINKYIDNGSAEIHWNNEKISHYDLVENLLATNYKTEVINCIKTVKGKFDESEIARMIDQIDAVLPESHADYKLSNGRKELITKLVTLRAQKLFTYLG